ncbi:ATP-dependent DNA helicase RecG [Endozoicomonas montiporae]|uniref:ATP-dependent DNA helicase RecG n=2 Tax=Endozoicomonas montiporae TaxID=1027273 RepID=A0A081N0K3_9GAMM|nr:ATP-dependent DNA helicase RecG [Endozoicomonas montiporae]AMO54438.1 ATP-dependent DNA helicase RecG [Endozoicomonas montiporae CL-33]KEQ11976.1 ATP-dependent DNA helicase RecG [Endozoicomonas montiporae]
MSKPLHEIPVTALKGVGAALAEKLARIHIHTLQDLLFHLPLRYQDRTRITPIGALQPDGDFVVQGKVLGAEVVMGRRRSLLCRISDGTGSAGLRFYHFSAAQKNNLKAGVEVRCFGEPRRGASGLEFYHPEYRVIKSDNQLDVEETLTPVYPATEGLTQQRIRSLCDMALDKLNNPDALQDWLPEVIQQQYRLGALVDAVRLLHSPPPDNSMALLGEGRHPAQRRLAFEELLAHNLSMQKLRTLVRTVNSFPMPPKQELTKAFREQLSFSLTGAQERVVAEISQDMMQPEPMLRLVQGDVGSGKTVVAALAALQVVENGYQAAIMAPTEILAEQHERNFKNWLKPLGVSVAYLSGKTTGKKREKVLEEIASGEASVVVGTHALFQDDVDYQRLGLAIIDEQHRFGVHQRMALRSKGERKGGQPHQLIMTATPIPRTLAMSAYADLDCSIIDELPPGRTPVNTVVIGDDRREQVMQRLRAACLEGRQAYWVCTLIDESETLQCQAAEVTAEQLRETLPELSIGLVHGRMKASDKQEVMEAFKAGHLHLLVATTVIEVGVDVPNASLMIIENPERLGLAQLHQLRGRVGRGNIASHCLLMYHAPLSQQSRERLQVMRDSSDGFVIAEKDLELRGPGEVLGTRQTGLAQLRVAELERDSDLLEDVRSAAQTLLQVAPHNAEPLILRWLGHAEQYANV